MFPAIADAPSDRRPNPRELTLLKRGIATDGQVQLWVANEMARWLLVRLDRLGRQIRNRVTQDILAGRIKFPAPLQPATRATGDAYDDAEFWSGVTDEWAEDAQVWIEATIPGVAQYHADRFRFFVDMRRVNEQVLAYTTERYIPELIRLTGDMSIIAATRGMVRDTIAQWQRGELPGGTGLGDLSHALMSHFSAERARRIAITEATRVYAQGSQLAWLNAYKDPTLERASGIIAKRWQTAHDEFVCNICRPLHGKVVLITRDFPVEGGIPPAHVNCRCWLVPAKTYNPRFHPPGVPSGPKGRTVRVRRPTASQIRQAKVVTGAR